MKAKGIKVNSRGKQIAARSGKREGTERKNANCEINLRNAEKKCHER